MAKLHQAKLLHFTDGNDEIVIVTYANEFEEKVSDCKEDGYKLESSTDIEIPSSFPINSILAVSKE